MKLKHIDITGVRFGRLVAIKRLEKNKKHNWVWLLQCDCGNLCNGVTFELRKGKKQSCGCLHKEVVTAINKKIRTIHGMRNTRLYRIYRGIKYRCTNRNSKDYANYGERGILCEWDSFKQFMEDMYGSYQLHLNVFGERNTTIERIDNDLNYSKDNCRWATWVEQANNRRHRSKNS